MLVGPAGAAVRALGPVRLAEAGCNALGHVSWSGSAARSAQRWGSERGGARPALGVAGAEPGPRRPRGPRNAPRLAVRCTPSPSRGGTRRGRTSANPPLRAGKAGRHCLVLAPRGGLRGAVFAPYGKRCTAFALCPGFAPPPSRSAAAWSRQVVGAGGRERWGGAGGRPGADGSRWTCAARGTVVANECGGEPRAAPSSARAPPGPSPWDRGPLWAASRASGSGPQ